MANEPKKAGKAPTHEVFHVVGDGEKARWTKVGVAWSHSDGEGMNLTINYQPLVPGRMVIRKSTTGQEGGAK